MKKKTNRIIFLVAALLLFAAAGVLVYQTFRPDRFVEPEPTPTPTATPVESQAPVTAAPEEPIEVTEEPALILSTLPRDKLFITPERQRYVAHDLAIVIPRLDYKNTVGNGTSDAVLKIGPGLYDYAQLPNEDFHNTSIAAHRRKSDFYYLDEMTTDDYFYLIYGDSIYRYLYESTYVVEPSDWGPIFNTGYSMLTLTTCTPIGISDHRMIVTATLDGVFEYADDFVYASNVSELPALTGNASTFTTEEVQADG